VIRRGVLLLVLAVVWPVMPPPAVAAAGNTTLADCDAFRREHPEALEPYICYWLVGGRTNTRAQASTRLREILDEEPGNGKAELYLGLVDAEMGREAEPLFRSAAASCALTGDRKCEAYARRSLIIYKINRRRLDGIERDFEQADAAATATGDPSLLAGLTLDRARFLSERSDYGGSWAAYKKAESALFPDGPPQMQARVLDGLGAVAWATGRYREAIDFYTRTAELNRRRGALTDLASALYNIALLGGRLLGEGDMTFEEVRGLQQEALDAARAAGSGFIEVFVLTQMAQDPGVSPSEQVALLRQALDLARRTRNPNGEMFALRYIALTQVHEKLAPPTEAYPLVEEAIRLAERAGDLEQIARGKIIRASMRWATGPREQALADSQEAMEAIERIRDLQADDLIRARSFSEFAFFYYRFIGHLLATADGSPAPSDLERAFAVAERLRARVLMQSLDAAGVVRPRDTEEDRRHEALLESISRAQRQLRSEGADVEALLAEIERLEIEEAAVRGAIARQNPRFSSLVRPSTPGLHEVQAALGPDQALLAFQLSSHGGRNPNDPDNGGSWVFVLTRDAVTVIPLPNVEELEPAVSIFLGSLQRRDELARTVARRLGAQLLDDALAGLPPRIRRLVIVPDQCLHRLPFGALAITEDGYLAERYVVSVVPSAALWLRWKSAPDVATDLPVLAVADPDSPGASPPSSLAGIEPWSESSPLGTLGHARKEARTAVLLARGGTLLEGREATERWLKRIDLSRFGILHIAAHSFVDEERPDRSAIVLAPGAEDEDGLLQIRELVSLSLDDRLVVLSACSTASGAVLAGEGVMGLARGFFQAGARTVVGSLWPLRDDEASRLMPAFYAGLAEGQGAAAALAGAQRRMIRSGSDPAAWAGLVVLGDGDQPVLTSPPRAQGPAAFTATSILLGLIIPPGIVAFRAARSRRRTS